MKIGYRHVSKFDQDEALQLDALNAAGCEKIFTDKITEAQFIRAGLDEALAFVRPGDVFVVWKLDRLGRSLGHLIEALNKLRERGVDFVSLTEKIDTSTPGGKLFFHMMGALAEFERDLIRERTMAGLAAARARGRKGEGHQSSKRMGRWPWRSVCIMKNRQALSKFVQPSPFHEPPCTDILAGSLDYRDPGQTDLKDAGDILLV